MDEQNLAPENNESVSPEQESAMIQAMDAVDKTNDTQDFDPEATAKAEQTESEQKALAEQGAQMTAYMGLAAIEMAIQSTVHPRFKIPDHNRDEVIQNCAPVLIKYGALVPEWLAAYQEEITALKAIGSLGMASYGEIKRLNAEDKALLAADAQNDDQVGDTTQEAA
ncbi:hypothetical protein L4D00_11760 [Photobacterium swingsii]|uniref:hypothetical protein n=1 Tax=Photobacterium swingsii TaxID=680026 RepID=UPI003D0B6E09